MTIENAIDCGGFIVEYDEEAEVTEPEISEKTFAVFGVLDRKAGKRLPFHEAMEKGTFVICSSIGQLYACN